MKLKINILYIIISLNFCFSQTKRSKEYNFYSYPSFHPAFSFKIKTTQNKIELKTTKSIYVADSISKDGFFKIMENERVNKISKFIPSGNTFYQEIDENAKKILIKNLEQLSVCTEDRDLVGYDGIYFYVYEGENSPCKYWSPNNDSKQGKQILEILNYLKLLFDKNSYVQNFINNSKKYIERDYIEVKNENPLYIKLYAMPSSDCSDLKLLVEKLPKSDEIFIDITEFEDEKIDCFLDELTIKYRNLRWIQNQMFDKFNSIEKIKE